MKKKSWERIGAVKHSLRRNLTKLTKIEIEYSLIKKEMKEELENLDEIMNEENLENGGKNE